MMQMTEEIGLEIINIRASCEGQFTLSARESRTCIDYALASRTLGQYLVYVHIDEASEYSFGSYPNRVKL